MRLLWAPVYLTATHGDWQCNCVTALRLIKLEWWSYYTGPRKRLMISLAVSTRYTRAWGWWTLTRGTDGHPLTASTAVVHSVARWKATSPCTINEMVRVRVSQSGQAIKLFHTPREISFTFHFRHVFHPSWCETWRVIQQLRMWHFRGFKTYSDLTYFRGSSPPAPMMYAPAMNTG